MSFVFTETLYQESGGEYAVSNEETQMEVQLLQYFLIFFSMNLSH